MEWIEHMDLLIKENKALKNLVVSLSGKNDMHPSDDLTGLYNNVVEEIGCPTIQNCSYWWGCDSCPVNNKEKKED